MGRDQDHDGLAIEICGAEASRELEPALGSEPHVDEHYVGAQRTRLLERIVARLGNSDDGHPLLFEQRPGGLEKGVVVIDQKAACRHALSVARTGRERITVTRNPDTWLVGGAGLEPATPCL